MGKTVCHPLVLKSRLESYRGRPLHANCIVYNTICNTFVKYKIYSRIYSCLFVTCLLYSIGHPDERSGSFYEFTMNGLLCSKGFWLRFNLVPVLLAINTINTS